MGRRKLTMKTLQNRNARRALFERRKKGLLKKASELSTLCGIDACVIIFPPPDSENPKAETFPQDPTQLIRNLQEYSAKKKCPEKQRKNYDLREFFTDRKNQVEAETSRVRDQRLKMLCPTWGDSFDNLGEDQLMMFIAALDCKLQECDQTIGLLNARKSEIPVVPVGLDLLNDHCLEIPITVIPSYRDVSDETHLDLGFMENMSDEGNVVSDPIRRLVGDSNTDLMESCSLQAQMLQSGSTWDDSFKDLVVIEKQQGMFHGSILDSILQECDCHMTDLFHTGL
ncbi:floral homeotic protein DEFICIENS-like [Neltuma alba]|uniref:floral homeotic protein DEFICIENS-like n=1 Tax=Neltuma alba TaxID=207710 RepID=UPI0010A4B053|nr:floral homeotic protein DEFICIENS-like [Prosopis alba]